MNKIKQWIYIAKVFLTGFDYGVKHFQTIEDKHFFTYHGDTDGSKLSASSKVYRNGIRYARKYMQYRNEILLLVFVLSSAFIFARCGW
jgi:hypothetical protein